MRYILHVTSRAVAGREDEYERWYADVHAVDMLSLPGFNSLERFRQLGMDGQPTGEFVALYEVETDDPAALLKSVFDAVPTMRLTDSIDATSARFTFLAPQGRHGV